ncbi:MAG: hypothetical protein KA115_02740 [Candidatus Moranbacteria bacterium]|nr:hypothetical protein [Candidatus Moranbacteria bacterium]
MDIKARRQGGMDGIRSERPAIAYRHHPAPTQPQTSIDRTRVQQRMLDGVVVAQKLTLDPLPRRSLRDRWSGLRAYILGLWRRTRAFDSGVFSHTPALALSSRQTFYVSVFGGVAFGVFMTAMTFMLLDHGVLAQSDADMAAIEEETAPLAEEKPDAAETMAETFLEDESATISASQEDVFLEYFSEVAEEEYRTKITEMVKGYPIEPMLPYIFEKDRTVAAFLVSIAKKESNWGKRVPVLEGQDCFNYWGYRGVRRLMGTGGHTCFNSRKDAVDTVARRIEKLVYSEQLNTPEKMILWKCGFSCEGHSRESVKKWISDVDMYFSRLEDNGY